MHENYQDVLDQLTEFGLLVDTIESDRAKPKRVAVNLDMCPVDKGKERSAGWYQLNTISIDGKSYLVGSYGYWKGADNNAQKIKWDKKVTLTPEQRQAMADQHKAAKKHAQVLRNKEIQKAATAAQKAWRYYVPEGQCDYLDSKKVGAHGVRFHPQANTMAVPMQDAKGKLFGLQIIRGSNRGKKLQKQYWPAGLDKSGHYHLIGSPRELVLVAEGYATAASVHESTGLPIAVAYDANNLIPVSKALKKAYPQATIIICADDDYLQKCKACGELTTVTTAECTHCGHGHGKKNAGIELAQAAAMSVGGLWIAPNFINEQGVDIRNGKKLTDFNDLANHPDGGPHLVRAQIEAITANIKIARPATKAPAAQQGDGERLRPQALSIMEVDDLVDRFIYVDDVHGDNAFDTWTKEVVKVKKVQSLLPQFVRWDDIKSHPKWAGRAVYRDQIGFDPTEKDSNIICNRWSGWPTKPNKDAVPDDCINLLALLMYLCDTELNGDDVFNWVVSWLAYPIQNPGAKLDTALVLHGPQGTGKNLFFEAYGKIYGEHFSVITQDTMEDQFNSDWVDRKLFVLADEIVAVQERTHVKNKLKTMITGDKIRINQKMIAAYPEKNFFNMVFLSNEANPVVLEKRDRRHLVIWTPEARDQEFYNAVREEIDNGGVQALHQYLLNWDCGDFKSYTKPPATHAKQNLILLNADTPYVFLHEWKTGGLDLPFCPAPAGMVYKRYLKWCNDHGERWPKTSRQFLSSIRTEGVRSEKENHYPDYSNQGNKRTQFYIPNNDLMTQAELCGNDVKVISHDEGAQTKKDYFTDCYMQFNNAWENQQ